MLIRHGSRPTPFGVGRASRGVGGLPSPSTDLRKRGQSRAAGGYLARRVSVFRGRCQCYRLGSSPYILRGGVNDIFFSSSLSLGLGFPPPPKPLHLGPNPCDCWFRSYRWRMPSRRSQAKGGRGRYRRSVLFAVPYAVMFSIARSHSPLSHRSCCLTRSCCMNQPNRSGIPVNLYIYKWAPPGPNFCIFSRGTGGRTNVCIVRSQPSRDALCLHREPVPRCHPSKQL